MRVITKSETLGQTPTKEYAVYGEVYLSDGVYMDEELYTGTFYRCKVFSKEVNTYEYPEVVGAVTVGWSEQYYEEREDNINNNSNLTDDIKDEELEKLELEAQKDIREKSNKFYGKTVTKGKYYKDNKETHDINNAGRMWVNGEYVSKTHPLYKAGRYKGFEEAAFSSLANYDTSPEGQVYIITNPAWEGWVKVGMAVDAMDRIKNYQTSSPFRDYTLLYSYEVNDRRAGESAAHARLAKECDNINEWFRLPPAIANELILEVIHEY